MAQIPVKELLGTYISYRKYISLKLGIQITKNVNTYVKINQSESYYIIGNYLYVYIVIDTSIYPTFHLFLREFIKNNR